MKFKIETLIPFALITLALLSGFLIVKDYKTKEVKKGIIETYSYNFGNFVK